MLSFLAVVALCGCVVPSRFIRTVTLQIFTSAVSLSSFPAEYYRWGGCSCCREQIYIYIFKKKKLGFLLPFFFLTLHYPIISLCLIMMTCTHIFLSVLSLFPVRLLDREGLLKSKRRRFWSESRILRSNVQITTPGPTH